MYSSNLIGSYLLRFFFKFLNVSIFPLAPEIALDKLVYAGKLSCELRSQGNNVKLDALRLFLEQPP